MDTCYINPYFCDPESGSKDMKNSRTDVFHESILNRNGLLISGVLNNL